MKFKVGDRVTLVKYIAMPMDEEYLGTQATVISIETVIGIDVEDECKYPYQISLDVIKEKGYDSEYFFNEEELELFVESKNKIMFNSLMKEGL